MISQNIAFHKGSKYRTEAHPKDADTTNAIMNTLLLLISLATFSGFNSSLTEEWKTFVDPNGMFEVDMPDSLKIDTSKVETQIGQLTFVALQADERYEDGEVKYLLSFCDYPAGIFPADSTELIAAFFDETVAGSVESSGGEVLYSVDEEAIYPTRLWKITSVNGFHIKSKALLVGDRYYCLQIISPEKLSVRINGDKFFNSFKVLNT